MEFFIYLDSLLFFPFKHDKDSRQNKYENNNKQTHAQVKYYFVKLKEFFCNKTDLNKK